MKRYFYQNNHLVTVDGERAQRFFRHGSRPLAQLQPMGASVLGVDLSGSVYSSQTSGHVPASFTYSPYGWCWPGRETDSGLRFNGEWPERTAGLYLLGNGLRGFSTALMRFVSPDSLSPFGEGGINSYAYCTNDPIGKVDPSGKNEVPKLTFLALNAVPDAQRFEFAIGGKLQGVYNSVIGPIASEMRQLKALVVGDLYGEASKLMKDTADKLGSVVFDITMKHYSDLQPELREVFKGYSANRAAGLMDKSGGRVVPVFGGGTTAHASVLVAHNKSLAKPPSGAEAFGSYASGRHAVDSYDSRSDALNWRSLQMKEKTGRIRNAI